MGSLFIFMVFVHYKCSVTFLEIFVFKQVFSRMSQYMQLDTENVLFSGRGVSHHLYMLEFHESKDLSFMKKCSIKIDINILY
jgi:hypothetical protein